MDVITIILIAIGLAMDCFAVSIAKGLANGRWQRQALWMVLLFGIFQGAMPLIGYFAGAVFSAFFSRFAPWIALVLLGYIGSKMIWDSLHNEKETHSNDTPIWLLAIATSIDALATGVVFIPYPEVLWMAIGIIALVSFVFSLVGYCIGWKVGERFTFNVELLGGIILIAIGLKICLEGIL